MKTLLPIMLTAIFIVSCATTETNERKEIKINPEQYQDQIHWADCSEINLHQPDSLILIGNIDKTICSNDKFLVCSRGKLLLFNQNGCFIGHIGQRGRAHNEYIGYTDCWIDGDHIFLYDMNGKKILKYTFDNQLVLTIHLNEKVVSDTYPFAFIVPLGQYYLGRCVWNGSMGESPALAIYNKDFSFNRTVGDLTIRSGLRIGYPLVSTHNSALFWNPLGRTIYRIMQDATIEPEYTISFGDKNYPDIESVQDDYEILDLYQDKAWRETHAGSITYVWETEQNLLFIYAYGEYMYLGNYNRTTNNILNYRFPDSSQTKILSCAFNGEQIFFFVETPKATKVYAMSTDKYKNS